MAVRLKKALVQLIYHVRDCLLQETQQLSDSHQATGHGALEGWLQSPSTPFTAAREEQDRCKERGKELGGSSPAHSSSLHFLPLLKVVPFTAILHPSYSCCLLGDSPPLTSHGAFCILKYLISSMEKKKENQLCLLTKKFWIVFLFLIQEVFYHGLFGIICEFNEL